MCAYIYIYMCVCVCVCICVCVCVCICVCEFVSLSLSLSFPPPLSLSTFGIISEVTLSYFNFVVVLKNDFRWKNSNLWQNINKLCIYSRFHALILSVEYIPSCKKFIKQTHNWSLYGKCKLENVRIIFIESRPKNSYAKVISLWQTT